MKNIKPKYFSTILFHIYFFSISANSAPAYTPTDIILLSCGSSANESEASDGRIWSGDIRSKFGPTEQSDNITSVKKTLSYYLPSSIDEVPYKTARISLSQFTYTFPVSAGPKFIRLHFFQGLYLGFETPRPCFSVKAGPHDLLTNFTADSSFSQPSLIKEFCVNVEDDNQQLNITFAPSTTTLPDDVYAFVNGIEIVSMPTDLYYTRSGEEADGFSGIISQSHRFTRINKIRALQMVYRLNVGGSMVSPTQDSGMYRTWYEDNEYLLDNKIGVLPSNTSISIKYNDKTPAYTAPEQVYKTARTMGVNKTENERYRLTWRLRVDAGFKYLVRLHFCEFQPEVMKEGDRVFSIYINNEAAEDLADVIYWSGGNGIPVYMDYVVWINKFDDVLIDLRPQVESRTKYSDGILNGIEMFKISNPDGDLAVPNSEPRYPPGPIVEKPKTSKTVLIAVSGSVVVVLAILAVLCYSIFRRLRKTGDHGSYCGLASMLWCWWDPYKAKSSRTKASSLPHELCRHFSLAEIQTATNYFDHTFIIGVGGFGNVYKGYIDGGDTLVAIKRLNPASRQGALEFKTEIELLSQLRYLHLVSLIGYCNDKCEMILVYDYMINGTLRDHLYETDNDPLPWKQRLQICIGAAKGLHYLHAGVKHTIIHRDVKSTNILLDEKWVAKVSDFGLSKMGLTSMCNNAMTTSVKGTWGYLDPEYIKRQRLTEKSDVYSFGVVLFEVLCARKAVNHMLEEDEVSLAHWVQTCIQNRTLSEIIDPYLMGNIAPVCLKKFVGIADSCLRDNGIDRPQMGDVVRSLEFALELQESAEAANNDINFDSGTHNEYIYEEISLCTTAANPSGRNYEGQGAHVLDSSISEFTMGTSTSGQSFLSSDSQRMKSTTAIPDEQ